MTQTFICCSLSTKSTHCGKQHGTSVNRSVFVGVTNTSQMNRSWSSRRHWSPGVNLGFLCTSVHIQYQCQQLWDCLYTDAGVLDDNCLAAALRGWNWEFFSPLGGAYCVWSGMWETVAIKVFCNSIKDSSPTVPPSSRCYPTPIPRWRSLSIWEPVASAASLTWPWAFSA